MLKLFKSLKKLQTYIIILIFFGSFIGGVLAYAKGYSEIPTKVKSLDKKSSDNTIHIKALSENVNRYIEIHKEQRKSDKEQRDLMFKIIERLTE